MGSMTRDDALGNAGADDMQRRGNGARIAARANWAIDVNFIDINISAATQSDYSSYLCAARPLYKAAIGFACTEAAAEPAVSQRRRSSCPCPHRSLKPLFGCESDTHAAQVMLVVSVHGVRP